jgi:hypothetical protein
MIVYQATNLINNKRYVCVTGRTLNIAILNHRARARMFERRMKLKPTAKMGKSPFHKALVRYGEHNFSYSLVESFYSKEDAYSYKERLIKEWNTTNPDFGYNCTTGGLESYSMTTESIERMSVAGTGKKQPESYVKIMKERVGELHPCFGYKHTKEAKKNMKQGQLNSDYVQSEETKRQKSEAMKKRWQEQEFIAKMANRKLRDISGENNPMYGVSRKGKDNPMYGRIGALNPNYGKPIPQWQKDIISKKNKEHARKRKVKLLKEYSQRTEKECYRCKKIKKLDMFYKSKINLDGYAGHCKPCDADRKRKIL